MQPNNAHHNQTSPLTDEAGSHTGEGGGSPSNKDGLSLNLEQLRLGTTTDTSEMSMSDMDATAVPRSGMEQEGSVGSMTARENEKLFDGQLDNLED